MASYNQNNPIRTVAPYDVINETSGTPVYVPVPSKYQYQLSDVSDSSAGRTEDTLMHKNRIGQKVHIDLEFPACNLATVSEILQAFNSEYIRVNYLDAYDGAFKYKVFYVGDRSTPAYNIALNVWENVSFSIIER